MMKDCPWEKVERNKNIYKMFKEGTPVDTIAKIMHLSRQRIHVIIKRQKNSEQNKLSTLSDSGNQTNQR